MSKKLKTQWHPAFVSAMKLELIEDAQYLNYISEYNLNSKPLEMDLLIVKKEKDVEIKNEIGKIFRKHNIVEYKSPDDSMNLNTYMKVVAYACLYKSYEEHVGDIRLEDITITLVRESKPVKLFSWFKLNGYEIKEVFKGIYHVIRENHFLTQVIVSKQLSKENQKWLTLLSKELDNDDAKRVISQLETLTEEQEIRFGDSVLQVAMQENEKIFGKIKQEEGNMCEALRKFFEPELNEAIANAEKQAEKQTAKKNAWSLFENGGGYELVRASITSLSDEELQTIYQEATKK